MGVKDEFHQKAILVCIDELCQRSTSKESELLVVTANGNDGDSSGHTGQTPPHRMVESSFQSLERCDKCHKFLRGLLHQGLICHCKSHLSWLHLKAVHLTVLAVFFFFFFSFMKQHLQPVDWLHIVHVLRPDCPLVFKDYQSALTGFIIEQVCCCPRWRFSFAMNMSWLLVLLIEFLLVQFLE